MYFDFILTPRGTSKFMVHTINHKISLKFYLVVKFYNFYVLNFVHFYYMVLIDDRLGENFLKAMCHDDST